MSAYLDRIKKNGVTMDYDADIKEKKKKKEEEKKKNNGQLLIPVKSVVNKEPVNPYQGPRVGNAYQKAFLEVSQKKNSSGVTNGKKENNNTNSAKSTVQNQTKIQSPVKIIDFQSGNLNVKPEVKTFYTPTEKINTTPKSQTERNYIYPVEPVVQNQTKIQSPVKIIDFAGGNLNTKPEVKRFYTPGENTDTIKGQQKGKGYISAAVENAANTAMNYIPKVIQNISNLSSDQISNRYSNNRKMFNDYFSQNEEQFNSIFGDYIKLPFIERATEKGRETFKTVRENLILSPFNDTYTQKVPKEILNLSEQDLLMVLNDYYQKKKREDNQEKIDEKYSHLNPTGYKTAKLVGNVLGEEAVETVLTLGMDKIVDPIKYGAKAVDAAYDAVKVAKKADDIKDSVSFGKKAVDSLKTVLVPTKYTLISGGNVALDKYEQNILNGNDRNASFVNALGTGYISSLTEKLGFEELTGVVGKINKGVTGSFGKSLRRIFTNYGINAASEGFEEVLDNLIGGAWDKATIYPEITWGEIFDPKKNAESFAGGALVGTILGGLGTAYSVANLKTDSNNIKQKIDTLNEVNKTLPGEFRLNNLDKDSDARDVNEYTTKLIEKFEESKDNVKDYYSDMGLLKKLGSSIEEIKKVGIVSKLEESMFEKGDDSLLTQVDKYFNTLNNSVYRKGFGDIQLNKKGIKSSIGHKMGRVKAIAFHAVPDVIKKGVQIDVSEKWKGRNYDTYVFAAPVQLNEKQLYMGVVVKKDKNTNEYYLHEVIDAAGNIAVLNKKRVEPFKTEPFVLKTSLGGSTPISNSISQPDNTVNNNTMQNNGKNTETSKVIHSLSRIMGGAEVTETDVQSLIKTPEIFEAYTGNQIKANAETEIRQYIKKINNKNARTNSIILAISDKTGLAFDYDITLSKDIAGFYDAKNKKIVLNPAHDKALDYAVVHELTHFVENKKGYSSYKQSLLNSSVYQDFLVANNYANKNEFRAHMEKLYKEVYNNLSKEAFNEAIDYEMAAKLNEYLINSEPDALKRLANKDTGIKAVFRNIAEFFEEIYHKLNGNSEKAYALKKAREFRGLMDASETYKAKGIKFSAEELSELRIVDKKFKAMLKDYDDGKRNGYVFDLGKSPKWFNNNFLSNKRVDLTPNIIKKAVEKHNIPLKNLENLVYEVQNPIMAFPSISENVPEGTQNIVVLTNIKNAEGFPVVCAIRLDQNNRDIVVDRITSIQKKDNIYSFLERSIREADNKNNYINGKRLLYVNNKKATEWIAAIGLQLPKQAKLLQLLNNNIPHQKSIVNTNSMQNQRKYSVTKETDTSNFQTFEKSEAQKKTTLISRGDNVSKTEDIRRKTSQKIFKEFSVPVNQRTDLKALINAALKKVEQGNTPSEVIGDSLFNLLEKNSKVVDDSIYNQYKDLKELIRTTKLHFSEDVRKDFSEAESFRKSNMGTLSLNQNEGRGIDDFYQELCNSHPDVFSDEIINSADQLREISDVAKSISKESMSVTEAGKKEGLTKEYFENILKSAYNEHFISYFENEVRKGSDKITNKQKQKYIELKAGRPYSELTELEMNDYNKKLNKEIENFRKDKAVDTVEKILSMVEKSGNNIIDTTEYIELNEGAPDIDNYVLEKFKNVPAQFIKGNQMGMTFDGKDIYRNNDMVSGKSKEVRTWLSNLIEKPLEDAKGNYVKKLKGQVDFVYSEIVKGLNIKMGSKESAAVQWYGEGVKPQKKGESKSYTLDDLKTEFPEKWEDIVKADKFLRKMYNDYIDSINTVLKQIYPNVEKDAQKLQNTIDTLRDNMDSVDEDTKKKSEQKIKELEERIDNLYTNRRLRPRKDYYRHFQEEGGAISSLMNILKTDIQISPDLIKVSENTKPLTKWWGALQHRNGDNNYKADGVGAILNYIPNAEYKIHIEPYIGHMRKVINSFIKETSQSKNANGYIKYLIDWTNDLSGKTNSMDRLTQNKLSRRIMGVVDWIGGRARANAIVGNLRTAVVQVFNLPNATMYIKNPVDWGNGVKNMVLDMSTGNKLIDKSVFINERYLDEVYSKFRKGVKYTPEKLCNFMLSAGDKAATTYIWYSAYSEGVRKKLDNPVLHADRITRRSVAGRGIGELPLMQKSKVIKMIAPFQVEVSNSWEIMKEKGKQGDLFAFLLYSASAWALNSLAEAIFGDKVIPDIVDIISDASSKFDEEPALKNVGQASLRLGGGIISAMPFASVIASALIPDEELRNEIFGDDDPSRYGVGVFGVEQITNIIAKSIAGTVEEDDFVDFAASYLLPYGGKQIARSYKGYKDVTAGGSYTNKGQLRFPITTNEDKTKTILFGPYSTKKAQEYLEELKPLGDKQTEIYKQMINLHNGRKYQDEIFYTFKGYSEYKKQFDKTVLSKKEREKYVNTLSPLHDMPNSEHIREWFINNVDARNKKE